MSALLIIAAMQAAQSTIPAVTDAPPQLLWAGYDQCLDREIDRRVTGEQSPEVIFDASQDVCAFWLDAYIEKIRQNVIATNVDFDAEKVKVVTAMRDRALPVITERQIAAKRLRSAK